MDRKTFRTTFRRDNTLLDAIYGFFLKIASYPMLLMEVFIRSHMGYRHFRLSSAITVLGILVFIPILWYKSLWAFMVATNSFEMPKFWDLFTTWYLFTALFVGFSFKRYRETYPGNKFNFNYFSLSSGLTLEFIDRLPLLKKRPSGYLIEVFIEPGLAVAIGWLLGRMGQPIGQIILLSGICYGFSYAAAYKQSEDIVQDEIDRLIASEEFTNAFVYDLPPKQTRGFEFKSKPFDQNLRQKVASKLNEEDDDDDIDFEVV